MKDVAQRQQHLLELAGTLLILPDLASGQGRSLVGCGLSAGRHQDFDRCREVAAESDSP